MNLKCKKKEEYFCNNDEPNQTMIEDIEKDINKLKNIIEMEDGEACNTQFAEPNVQEEN